MNYIVNQFFWAQVFPDCHASSTSGTAQGCNKLQPLRCSGAPQSSRNTVATPPKPAAQVQPGPSAWSPHGEVVDHIIISQVVDENTLGISISCWFPSFPLKSTRCFWGFFRGAQKPTTSSDHILHLSIDFISLHCSNRPVHIWMFPNKGRGKTPKMDGEKNGRPH